MAAITGTTQTYGVGTAGGLREDLEDVIWDLFADETQVTTKLEKIEASAVYHEWLLDSLASPASNIWVEGDDFTASSLTAPTRVGNYCQIMRKDFIVSGTLEEVRKAGRRSELARAAMKRMRELKNDLEFAIVRNQGSSAPAGATGRSMASMESWIATNEILSTSTSAATTPGFSGGVVAAPTDSPSTTAAFTENHLKQAVVAAWSAGGDASMILMSFSQKAVADTFTGIATRFRNVAGNTQASIISAADVYVSDVGQHKLVLHRHVRSSVVLAIDPEYWALAFLRRPRMETLAKTGDAEKRMLLLEATLVCRNEKASAKIVALS